MSDDDEAEAGGSSLLHKSLDNATANNDDPSERRLEDLDARIAENTRNGRISWKNVLAALRKSELPGDQQYWQDCDRDKLKEWHRKPRNRKPRKRDDHRKRPEWKRSEASKQADRNTKAKGRTAAASARYGAETLPKRTRCKCGSFDHLNISHSSCLMNPNNKNKPAQMRSFEEVALREAQNANDGTNLTEPEAEAARRIAS